MCVCDSLPIFTTKVTTGNQSTYWNNLNNRHFNWNQYQWGGIGQPGSASSVFCSRPRGGGSRPEWDSERKRGILSDVGSVRRRAELAPSRPCARSGKRGPTLSSAGCELVARLVQTEPVPKIQHTRCQIIDRFYRNRKEFK